LTLNNKDEVIKEWLKKGGFLTIIKALRTSIDFLRVIYIIYIRVLYKLINFTQESSRDKRNGEVINSIILLDN
jgi:hypothetical protein